MIRSCKICGKQFEGRADATLCSGTCRLEAKRRYAKEYRECHGDRVRAAQRKWWNNNRAKPVVISQSDNLDLTFESAPKKKNKKKTPEPKYTGSKWAKVYTKANRLTKISMLSWQLSKLEIAHLSYGELSLIWDTEKYNNLLYKVLKIKQEEEKCKINTGAKC